MFGKLVWFGFIVSMVLMFGGYLINAISFAWPLLVFFVGWLLFAGRG